MSGSRWFDKSLILRDGVKLISRIWLPNSNGPWPALLMRQPYGREIASTITYSHPEWWASKGYMVIIQDVRGCLLYTSPSPRDSIRSRMPSSA